MDYLNENYEKKLNTIFSDNLKRCMQYYQIRNVDLSNRLNVSVQTVSAWTNGNKMPRMKMLDKICEVLHCNRSELLDEGGFATMEGRKTIEYYEERSKAYDEYLKSLPFDHPEILSIRWMLQNQISLEPLMILISTISNHWQILQDIFCGSKKKERGNDVCGALLHKTERPSSVKGTRIL